MLTNFLLTFILVFPTSTFRLHNTREHLDCLYLYTSDGNKSISSLVPYCLGSQDVPNINRCYGRELPFDQLKWNNVTVTDLYTWNAPVDTINDYQMFLQNRLPVHDGVYCNCTDQRWFGANCEYTFVSAGASSQFGDILHTRFISRKSILGEISFLQPNTTCYQELACDSIICLDWRDICNEVWECTNGEDEVDCVEIDIRGCRNEEFRCRNGMCIDRNFLFDGFHDCADGSDEHKKIEMYQLMYPESISVEREEGNWGWGWDMFSCGDGTYHSPLFRCPNGRGNAYLNNLYANPHEQDSNETLCWQTMICSMAAVFGSFVDSSSLKCRNICQYYDSDCFKLRLEMCPKYYYFPSKRMTYHSSVYFMYNTTATNPQFRDMVLPTFVCFDKYACSIPNCEDFIEIDGHKCDHYTNQWIDNQIFSWNTLSASERKDAYFQFIANLYRHDKKPTWSKCSQKLYNCRSTNTCISKFWLYDGERDCTLGDDEDSKRMCEQNSTDHFQCKKLTSTSVPKCISRKHLMNTLPDCSLLDDELYALTCDTGKSLGCKYLRNDKPHIRTDYFTFQELCNGVITSIDRKNNNETDEDDCEEWQKTCKNRAEPCANGNKWKLCIPNVWNCNRLVRSKYKPFTFEGFNHQPSSRISFQSTFISDPTKSQITHLQSSKDSSWSDYVLHYCNQGVLLTTQDGTDRCLCPPSYYGHSCQYQSRRVLMIISIDMIRFNKHSSAVLRVVVSLLSEDNDQAFSIEQVTHIFPIHTYIWRHLVYLRYPNNSNFHHFYVRIDVFFISSKSVSFLSSWRYEIPFQHILPVNRVRAHLQINSMQSNNMCSLCSNGKCIIYANVIEKSYCLCNEGWYGERCQFKSNGTISSCALGAQTLFTNVCVCPLFAFGDKCYIQSDSQKMTCTNGGTLLSESSPSLCLCPEGFHGSLCQFKDANVVITFSESDHVKKTIPIVAIHLLDLDSGVSVTEVRTRLILSNVQPSSTYPTIFFHGESYLPPFIFMQLYFDISNTAGDFYLIALLKQPINTLRMNMLNIDRCPNVNTLFNSTFITKNSRLKRYKSYFKICLIQNMKCFVDEQYLCLCDSLARFECLWFDHQAINCTAKGYCQNGGYCVEPSAVNGSVKFACLCASCTFGDVCQFTTAHYSISLDALVGVSGAVGSTFMSYLMFGIVLLLFIIGLVCNLFSFILFCRSSFQETGCGFYILCLTVVGQLGLTIFVLKFIFLLKPSSSYNQNLWSCRIIESAISFIPPLYDWLTACIALERTFMILQGVQFNCARSKIIARYIALPITILFTFGSTFHKATYRHVINDFRSNEPTWWCIMEFDQNAIKNYDIVVNIVHLTIPLFINLITTFYFLLAKTRRKRLLLIKQLDKNTSYCSILREQFRAHIPFIISPIILSLLQTPRLILSFALVCIQAPWQVHFYIVIYLVSCLPLMAGTLVLFIIPSPTYRENIKNIFHRFRSVNKQKRRAN